MFKSTKTEINGGLNFQIPAVERKLWNQDIELFHMLGSSGTPKKYRNILKSQIQNVLEDTNTPLTFLQDVLNVVFVI